MLDHLLMPYIGAQRTFTTSLSVDQCWQRLEDDVSYNSLTRIGGWQPLRDDPTVLRHISGDQFVLTPPGARRFRWGFTGTITMRDGATVIHGRYGMTKQARQASHARILVGLVMFGILAFLFSDDIQNLVLRVLASSAVVIVFAIIIVIDHRRMDVQGMQEDEMIVVGALQRLLGAQEQSVGKQE